MDIYTHTIISVSIIAITYYIGRYLHKMSLLDNIVSSTLDKLEEDGYIEVKMNICGEKELIKIEKVIEKRLEKSLKV
ncbi:MAG: hypothetical protein CMO16_06830 [Thaumarchaeota archaeon]|nr:hypothetical protein [Nitrososphaerota archaeon]